MKSIHIYIDLTQPVPYGRLLRVDQHTICDFRTWECKILFAETSLVFDVSGSVTVVLCNQYRGNKAIRLPGLGGRVARSSYTSIPCPSLRRLLLVSRHHQWLECRGTLWTLMPFKWHRCSHAQLDIKSRK